MPVDKGFGDGTIYFNKQRNKWNAQYLEFNSERGCYTKKTKSFKTEDEAKKFLSTIMYQKGNSLYVEHNGIPLCEMMRANLKTKLDTNQISTTQFARVTHTIDKIAKTPVGCKNIDEITVDELQAYLNSQKYLSNSSLSKIYGQFNQAFLSAFNKGYIMKNPMYDVIKPRSDKEDKEVRALTVEEQQVITNHLLNTEVRNCKYKNVYLIQMYLGLRCGEALALDIHDIDLKNRKVHIHRTLTTDENNKIVMGNKTKTYAGKRVVPIPQFIIPHIMEQMKIATAQDGNPEKLLFKPDDKPYTSRTNVNSELKRILKRKFNITDITTHSLRHTFGTRCIESGMDAVVVQKLMGHRDIMVTLNTYTSVFDKYKASQVDKVNQYYLDENITMLDEISSKLLPETDDRIIE